MQTEASSASRASVDRATVVVLGGYSNFGTYICEALAHDHDVRVVVAGRDHGAARALAERLGAGVEAIALDRRDGALAATLRQRGARVVVHTCGPFQGQHYGVASACIDAGCHYIDIADAREYVAGIDSLHPAASARGVLIASGASSLPALSSAVVDREAQRFARLDEIRYGIASSAKIPGLATVQAVMSYVGKPFDRWEDGRWVTVHGWQDVTLERYPEPVGHRFLASCDVPDLALFPRRYPLVRTIVFRAGLGFAATTLATWAFSWLVRGGVVKDMTPYAPVLRSVATRLERWGTQTSAMQIRLSGIGHDGAKLVRTWSLVARGNHGTRIPCLPAIALARKLVRGVLGVDEILGAVPGLDIRTSAA